jgi:KipI family sensor histidine kinase inhibitor
VTARTRSAVTVTALGDSAVLATLDRGDVVALARRAQALARSLDGLRRDDDRWGLAVPGAASVLVPFDPLALDPADAARAVARIGRQPVMDSSRGARRVHDVPVRYGGEWGPDLDAVAAAVGLTPGDVVDVHASVAYEVLFLGFQPGFGYLGELPAKLVLPRRETPRPRVPAGSVAIADRYTAIYPLPSPGGWHLIGQTEVGLFDAAREDPVLLRAGDSVRFVPLRVG